MKRYPKNMVQIHWTIRSCAKRLWERLKLAAFLIKLTFCTLCYNDFADKFYIGDTCMEPMFWFVDHFTKVMGPIFVAGVIVLKFSIVVIAYTIGLSFWWQASIPFTVVLLIVGHWLLINVVFHYYMAYITLPGFPPEGALVPEAVSICKRCISPKPPRTHHCSVCNRCILKMDHHCLMASLYPNILHYSTAWLNNCIGFHNHRYFFMYCVYVWMGVSFLLLFGAPVAYVHFFGEVKAPAINATVVSPQNGSDYLHKRLKEKSEVLLLQEEYSINITATILKRSFADYVYHACLVYAALICIGVFLAIGALTMWHARLITRGETSVESHINKKEMQRLAKEGKVYKNPYNFGPKKNWILFLGLTEGRNPYHVIFPSSHKPDGDGLRWHTSDEIITGKSWDAIIGKKDWYATQTK